MQKKVSFIGVDHFPKKKIAPPPFSVYMSMKHIHSIHINKFMCTTFRHYNLSILVELQDLWQILLLSLGARPWIQLLQSGCTSVCRDCRHMCDWRSIVDCDVKQPIHTLSLYAFKENYFFQFTLFFFKIKCRLNYSHVTLASVLSILCKWQRLRHSIMIEWLKFLVNKWSMWNDTENHLKHRINHLKNESHLQWAIWILQGWMNIWHVWWNKIMKGVYFEIYILLLLYKMEMNFLQWNIYSIGWTNDVHASSCNASDIEHRMDKWMMKKWWMSDELNWMNEQVMNEWMNKWVMNEWMNEWQMLSSHMFTCVN